MSNATDLAPILGLGNDKPETVWVLCLKTAGGRAHLIVSVTFGPRSHDPMTIEGLAAFESDQAAEAFAGSARHLCEAEEMALSDALNLVLSKPASCKAVILFRDGAPAECFSVR